MHSFSKLVVLVVVSLGLTSFAADEVRPLKVRIGASIGLILEHIQRVSIDNPAIADVKTTAADHVTVSGHSLGTTTLLVWREGESQPERFSVTVGPAGAEPTFPSAPLARTGRTLTGPTATLQVHESLIHDAKDVKRVAIADPNVADVNVGQGVLSVTGMSAGETTLIVMMNDGSRKEFRLVVR